MQNPRTFEDLVTIVRRLRGPGGCPWDAEQHLYSLKEHMIEEAYELLEALDDRDVKGIREELGDMLLHVVFHAVMAEEDDLFDVESVIRTISEKMIRRHPHVFGDTEVNGSDEVLVNWDKIKQEEKKERTSVLSGIPKGLPTIPKAQKLQGRARKVGFDWDGMEACMEKVDEEFDEFKEAVASGDKTAIEHELGDAMFALVNISRFLDVDADEALRKANQRFTDRFSYIEKSLAENGMTPDEATIEHMETLWVEAKKRGQANSGS